MATNGHRGRFSDRLRLIKLRKRKRDLDEVDMRAYFNIVKVMAAIPLMIYDNIIDKDNLKVDKSSLEKLDLNNLFKDTDDGKNIVDLNKEVYVKNKKSNVSFKNKNVEKKETLKSNSFNNVSKETSRIEVNRLEKKIIDRIKKNLIITVNELEILRNDLYILSEINNDTVELEKCEKNLREIKQLLHKVDALKNKYDYLKDNYDFEYILELDVMPLIDDIIELKKITSGDEQKMLVEDYKLLDVYKYLYLKIDALQDNMSEYEDYKNKQVLELKDRNIDFNEFKTRAYNVELEKEKYDLFIKEQMDMMDMLNKNMNKISSTEAVDYHLKGFGQLLINSFKYFSLLMLSPLRGMIPSIVRETVTTKNIISNLYHNLVWEEKKYRVYETVDYGNKIMDAINSVDNASRIVDETLEDIVNLKIQYNQQFKRYQGDINEYRDVIGKLNNMENKIMGNKIKMEIIKRQMKEQEKINQQKLLMIRKLNEDEKMGIVKDNKNN